MSHRLIYYRTTTGFTSKENGRKEVDKKDALEGGLPGSEDPRAIVEARFRADQQRQAEDVRDLLADATDSELEGALGELDRTIAFDGLPKTPTDETAYDISAVPVFNIPTPTVAPNPSNGTTETEDDGNFLIGVPTDPELIRAVDEALQGTQDSSLNTKPTKGKDESDDGSDLPAPPDFLLQSRIKGTTDAEFERPLENLEDPDAEEKAA